MYKQKVLILQDTLSDYNKPVFEILSENFELTLGYVRKNELENITNCKIQKLNYSKFLNLYIIRDNFFDFCNSFDVVVFSADMHHLSFCLLPFLPFRKYKSITWTLGIRASYKVRYDLSRSKNLLDYVYGKILNKSDALIFYMGEPLQFWNDNINSEKVFVAHNTIHVDVSFLDKSVEKNVILFVGTLYKEKKIYELLNAYKDALKLSDAVKKIKLEIIGEGVEFQNINDFIIKNNLKNSIILRGKITNKVELADAFNRTLICVSPDQAGLSVLLSMGYGVPFVTRYNSITGGERLNIINGFNGIFYASEIELRDIIIDSCHSKFKYLNMGKNAFEYYLNNATIMHMYNGFEKAINYVTKFKY